jgi:hypothetical protein
VATTIDKPEVGGNFHGACHGLDQAVRFINTKHLSQDIHAQNLGFYIGDT